MNTGNLQNTQDIVEVAERIFRGMTRASKHRTDDETCPFTLESLLNCPIRNNRRYQEPCPYSLDKCMI